jgi:hypothetical protein
LTVATARMRPLAEADQGVDLSVDARLLARGLGELALPLDDERAGGGQRGLHDAAIADDLVRLEARPWHGEVEIVAGWDGEGDLSGARGGELELDDALARRGGDGGGEGEGELEGAALVGDEGVVVVLDDDRGLDGADLGGLEGDGGREHGDPGPARGLEALDPHLDGEEGGVGDVALEEDLALITRGGDGVVAGGLLRALGGSIGLVELEEGL